MCVSSSSTRHGLGGLDPPNMSLSPPPLWKILVKNHEVNCAKFSNCDHFCSQNLHAVSANCFSFCGFPQIPYWGFAPGTHCGTSVPQTHWAMAPKIPVCPKSWGNLQIYNLVTWCTWEQTASICGSRSKGRGHNQIRYGQKGGGIVLSCV